MLKLWIISILRRDQRVSEQDYSSQGGIVLQDENARVHLGHLCLNYNLTLKFFYQMLY